MPNLSPFVFTVIVLAIPTIVIAWDSFRRGLLMPSQAVTLLKDVSLSGNAPTKGQRMRILTFVEHAPLWLDLWIITPTVAWIVGYYISSWSLSAIGVAFAIGTTITLSMAGFWKKHSFDSGDVCYYQGKVTLAGLVHELYMCFCLTVILLFYFATPDPWVPHVKIVTVLLGIHVAVGIIQPPAKLGKLRMVHLVQLLVAWLMLYVGYKYALR